MPHLTIFDATKSRRGTQHGDNTLKRMKGATLRHETSHAEGFGAVLLCPLCNSASLQETTYTSYGGENMGDSEFVSVLG